MNKLTRAALLAVAFILLHGCGGGNESTVKCKDGWETPSAGKQGACSSHGGLA
jgi:hypothetical protein